MHDIETLIPHRRRMRLIEEIIEFDEERCVTTAVAGPHWPLSGDRGVNPIVMIELVAQSIGAYFGMKNAAETGNPEENTRPGWLVGVKKAVFSVTSIPPGERLTVTARRVKQERDYVEVAGIVETGSGVAGDIHLQVFRPEE